MRLFDTAVRETSDQQTTNGLSLWSVGFALLVVRACGVVYGDIGTSGIHVKRDSGVSVVYAEGLNSAKSSVILQRTDRHGILG